MKKIVFILIFCFSPFIVLAQSDKWMLILLPDSSVSVSVPAFWKVKSPYQIFSDYQRKYSVKVSLPKRNTYLTADVYDSSYMYNFTINDGILEDYREARVKTVGRVDSVKKEVVSINGIDVAMLKYVCYDKKNIPRYGIIILFKKDSQHFYELSFFCGSLSVNEGKSLGKRIIDSLRLN